DVLVEADGIDEAGGVGSKLDAEIYAPGLGRGGCVAGFETGINGRRKNRTGALCRIRHRPRHRETLYDGHRTDEQEDSTTEPTRTIFRRIHLGSLVSFFSRTAFDADKRKSDSDRSGLRDRFAPWQ